jgi:uncharacterized phiE125 gp8 family phage protein
MGYGTGLVSAVTVAPTDEPLTVTEAKLRAALDWPDGDPRDDLMRGFIATARRKVETDGELALLTQTRVLQYDAVPAVLQLPVRPLQQVVAVTVTHTDGLAEVLPSTAYTVDLLGGRVAFTTWPTDLRAFQAWMIEVVAGWTAPAALPPELTHLVGLMTAHTATIGRDLTTVGTIIATTPYGYDELIAPWRPVMVA